MPRLISISWRDSPGLPGIRATTLATIQVGAPGFFQKWSILIDGHRLYLISPVAWAGTGSGTAGHRRVYELPRDGATFQWELSEDESPAIKTYRYDPPAEPVRATDEIDQRVASMQPLPNDVDNDPDAIVGPRRRR